MAEKAGTIKQTFRDFKNDNCPRMAAAMAYYTVFSLPPLLVILMILAGVFLEPQQVESWISGQVGEVVGPAGSQQLQTMAENAQERVQGGISWGLGLAVLALLFGATTAFAQLQEALNTAWGIKPDPNEGGVKSFLGKRFFSLLLILALGVVLIASLAISSALPAVLGQAGDLLPAWASGPLLWGIDLGVSLVVFALLFGAVYKVLPDAKVAWSDVMAGAVFASLIFVVGKFLFGMYVARSNPADVYGAAASLALLLLFIYVVNLTLFLGAEFAQVWARKHGRGIEPSRGAIRVEDLQRREQRRAA